MILFAGTICDVTGIRVGHAQIFSAEAGAVAGMDIRGSAHGTGEIALV